MSDVVERMAKHLIPAKYPNNEFTGYVMRCPNADPWNNQLQSTECEGGDCYTCPNIPNTIQVRFQGITEFFNQCCNINAGGQQFSFMWQKLGAIFPLNDTFTLRNNISVGSFPADPCRFVYYASGALNRRAWNNQYECSGSYWDLTCTFIIIMIPNSFIAMQAQGYLGAWYNYGLGFLAWSGGEGAPSGTCFQRGQTYPSTVASCNVTPPYWPSYMYNYGMGGSVTIL